jgi:MFS family permease
LKHTLAGSVTFPTISSIKANNASAAEQGAVQGALYAAKALAAGVGPLIFAWLFTAFSRTDSKLPFFPGAPFVFGAVIMLGGVVVATMLSSNAGGSSGRWFGDKDVGINGSNSSNDLEEDAGVYQEGASTSGHAEVEGRESELRGLLAAQSR